MIRDPNTISVSVINIRMVRLDEPNHQYTFTDSRTGQPFVVVRHSQAHRTTRLLHRFTDHELRNYTFIVTALSDGTHLHVRHLEVY